MQITFQTLNRYFNIKRNNVQENQKNIQGHSFIATNPFKSLEKDTFEISFKAGHCSTQNFQIKNRIENLRCPACGLIMLTDKQISNFATEVGKNTGEDLIAILEKYEDESTLTGKPSLDKTGHGVYRPLKKQVVDVYKELAKKYPQMDLLQLTQLEADRCLQELIDKQMLVIDELEDYIDENFDDVDREILADKIDGFVKQIKGEAEETFARKRFIYAMENAPVDTTKRGELGRIASKIPTSENDIDSFFVKYSHKTKSQDVARGLVRQAIPSAEHLLPRSKNGKNRLSNYICDCADCNSRRGNINFYDWLQSLPGFEDRLQLYIEDVQEAIDAQKLDPEYDTYIELIVETIANLSEGELVLEIPEIRNPEKKEVVMAKRGREVQKAKAKNEALIQRRNQIQEEIAALEKYPNFAQIDEHREILERIAQVNEEIQTANLELIETRKPINTVKEELAKLEAKRKAAKNPAEKADIKRKIEAKTQEYEALMDKHNKKEALVGKLRRKQIKLKKQRKYYNLQEQAIEKRLEELRILMGKISSLNERLVKLGNPAKKEEELRVKISEIEDEIAQKQVQNEGIMQQEGFNPSYKDDFSEYEHSISLLNISRALISGKMHKKTGHPAGAVKEIVEIAIRELEKTIQELAQKDTVIFFLNTNDIYKLQIKKDEHLAKLGEYIEAKQKLCSLQEEIDALRGERTTEDIQREFAELSGEKRIIEEIHKLSQKRSKLEELTRIINKNKAQIEKLENYRELSNKEWSELMSFVEIEDVL